MARHVPVAQLNAFLQDSSLIHTSTLREISGQRVGIDVATWMRKLKLPVLEALQPAMGGVPITFEQAVLRDISQWKTAKITPLFVFQGLSILRDKNAPFFYGGETKVFKRKVAWEQYTSTRAEGTPNNSVFQDDSLLSFMRSLYPIFVQNNVEYIVSPYLAPAQLAWFNENNFTECVYGGFDLLPYFSTSCKVITDIDFKNQTYTWVNPNEIMRALDATHDQFVDAYLLCTSEAKSSLRENIQLVKKHGRGVYVLQHHYHEKFREKLKTFQKSRALISFTPILNASCQCEPFCPNKVPNDLHDLFGPRMPSSIYFCISQAVVSTQVINPLLQCELIEVSPLVDSMEYRKILNDLMPIRSRTLALLIFPLNYQFISREVKTLRWFDETRKHLDLQAHYNKIEELPWNFSEAIFEKERSRQVSKQMDMNFIVSFLLHNTLESQPPKRSLSALCLDQVFSSEDQIIGQVIVHAFALLSLTETELEKKTFMGALSFVSPTNQPHALLILELLRYNNLSGNLFTFTDLNDLPNLTEDPNILLISRVLSVLPMNFKKESAWDGLVDHDLLAFNCILKALGRSVRGLFEMVLLSVLIRTKVTVNHKRFISISQRLPFYQENSTALGIVAKDFLMNGINNAEIIEKYPCCASPVEDLKKGIQFWNEIVLMVKKLDSQNLIHSGAVTQFEKADVLLKKQQTLLH